MFLWFKIGSYYQDQVSIFHVLKSVNITELYHTASRTGCTRAKSLYHYENCYTVNKNGLFIYRTYNLCIAKNRTRNEGRRKRFITDASGDAKNWSEKEENAAFLNTKSCVTNLASVSLRSEDCETRAPVAQLVQFAQIAYEN